jgi:uncharacterized repeat protein (TIGR01451 family)
MKKLLSLIALLLCLANSNAQTTVTIADTAFAHWLQINIPAAMNGDQMDTTHSAVTSMKHMNVQSFNIVNLDGVQYFDSLLTLDCSNNNFDTAVVRVATIPALPPMLTNFICNNNSLTNLPTLPAGLKVLFCNYNPLGQLPTLPVTLRNIECIYDSLTAIPTLPDSLRTFACGDNHIDSLPALPSKLFALNCAGNLLTALPALNDSLKSLICNLNQLQNLPVLPDSLHELSCTNNQLTSLPGLPNSLISMDCSYNQITALPVLPPNLPSLLCNSNNLTTLPALPASITFIDCSNNQITVLPTLPGALYKLNCCNNALPALPALPGTLAILHCCSNQLPALPALPSSLTDLNCDNNQLPALPALPASLDQLSCKTNLITSLPVLPNALSSLKCSFNHLSSLPALPASLHNLECGDNSIAALPSLPASLAVLYCNNNQLQALPVLPAYLAILDCRFNSIHCFDPFNQISMITRISNNPFTCIPNYIASMDSITLSVPLCRAGNPFGCPSTYGIVGFTYKDNDASCLKDSGDSGLKNVRMKIFDSSSTLKQTILTAMNGVYQFLDSAGVYSVAVDTADTPFDASCVYPGLDSTVTVTVLDTNVNFALACKPGFDVGTRAITHCGLVFPGQTHILRINAGDMSRWYNLYCAAGISGTVKVEIHGPVGYVGPAAGALTPLVSGNILTYHISDFATVHNTTDFNVLLQPFASAQEGDEICISVKVTPLNGDNSPGNNYYTACYRVVNSHDPNIKETYPEEVEPNYADWLTYTIHFQNTGSAPAFNIRLADTLDQDLDLSTFQITDYSHDNTTVLDGNILSVQFANIMLPDSASNPSGSIGFIQYRLKPKSTWTDSRKIKNTAYIYFDFNPAIVTNSTYNKIMKVTGLSTKGENIAALYPNPSNGSFTIELNTKEKQSIQLFDMTGNMVLSQTIENGKANVDASHLAAGIYNISIKGNGSVTNKKMVIVK